MYLGKRTLCMRLDWRLCLHVQHFTFFFFFLSVFSVFLTLCHTSGSVHCSRDPQISFFSNFFIKNWFHGTIHTFKNYFITIFSVFSKISDIQTDFTLSMPFFIQSFKPLLKYLVSQIRYCKGVRREPAKPREEC